MYELSWRHSVWCGNMCHVICKYRTFLTLMETPGLEAPRRGNEGMANCTQTVRLLYTTTHSGRQENGKKFINILLQTTRIRYFWRSQVFTFVMLLSRLCSPSVVMFGLGPDQYGWLGSRLRIQCTGVLWPCHQSLSIASIATSLLSQAVMPRQQGLEAVTRLVTRHMSRCHETCDIVTVTSLSRYDHPQDGAGWWLHMWAVMLLQM